MAVHPLIEEALKYVADHKPDAAAALVREVGKMRRTGLDDPTIESVLLLDGHDLETIAAALAAQQLAKPDPLAGWRAARAAAAK
jgi:hypothetical protein